MYFYSENEKDTKQHSNWKYNLQHKITCTEANSRYFSLFKKSPSVKSIYYVFFPHFITFFFILTTNIKYSFQQLASKEKRITVGGGRGHTTESCTMVFTVKRSEARRVGKECGSRRLPYHS